MFYFSDADFDDSIEDPFDTREIFDLIRNDMTHFFSHYLLLLFGVKLWYRLDRHSVTVRKLKYNDLVAEIFTEIFCSPVRAYSPHLLSPIKVFAVLPPPPFFFGGGGDSQYSGFWGLSLSLFLQLSS